MSTLMEDDIKRWTAKRKTALVLDIIQGKTTVLEGSRAFDSHPSEVEQWVDEGKRGMENALRTKPLEVKEQYEKQLRELQEAYGEAMLELRARKKAGFPAGHRGREMILSLQQGLAQERFKVSLVKLCLWFQMPRRTVYYRSTKAQPKVQEQLVKPIKAMIEENPSFGYRTVAHLLGFNKNTVQRIFQLKGWQVRKRPVGLRPRIHTLPSVAKAPEERWATDVCRVWTGRDGWASLALVIDCYSRELLGWHLSRSGRSQTAESALEQALLARYGCLGKVRHPFLLRSENGLMFTSRTYSALVKSYGLQQEFITPYSPEQNGMVERVIRTLKDQCVHRHRFETL